MAITRETVQHVARLARLDLGADEAARMERDLSNILTYVETLAELDTSGVAETAHVAVDRAPLRADETEPGVPAEVALSQSPRATPSGFAVPAFVDE
jgi:aspartyl-tRNA(Asn)/glutamyl-tRNA(Gln) amidotransferase subunit C